MAVYLVDLPVLFMAMFSFTRSFQFVESERDCYKALPCFIAINMCIQSNDINYFSSSLLLFRVTTVSI